MESARLTRYRFDGIEASLVRADAIKITEKIKQMVFSLVAFGELIN